MKQRVRLIAATVLCCCSLPTPAATGTGKLTVTITDRDGAPLPEVVAYVVPAHPAPRWPL